MPRAGRLRSWVPSSADSGGRVLSLDVMAPLPRYGQTGTEAAWALKFLFILLAWLLVPKTSVYLLELRKP